MKSESKPPIAKYPGNRWLVSKLDEFGIEATAPFVHGVIRGALANPVRMHPAEACESYFLDIVNEAKMCLNWYDNPEEFKKEYPDSDLRLTVLRGSLSMIEETMKWLQLYVRFAADDGSPFSGGVRTGRNQACPCGSGKKYKRCCHTEETLQ